MDARIEHAAKGIFATALEQYAEIYQPGESPTVPATVLIVRFNDNGKLKAQLLPPQLTDILFSEEAGVQGKVALMHFIKQALTSETLPWDEDTKGAANAVFVIVEAYMNTQATKEEPHVYVPGDLRDNPKSTEALILQIHTLAGTELLLQGIENGEIVGELQHIKDKELEGTMVTNSQLAS